MAPSFVQSVSVLFLLGLRTISARTVCTAKTPTPQNSICGVQGYLNNWEIIEEIPSALSDAECVAYCSSTPGCQSVVKSASYCWLIAQPLAQTAFYEYPNGYATGIDLSCYQCEEATSVTSTTSSLASTSTDTSASAVALPTSSPTACANSICGVCTAITPTPQNSICGVTGLLDRWQLIEDVGGELSEAECVALCSSTPTCQSVYYMSFSCSLIAQPLAQTAFHEYIYSDAIGIDLSCYQCEDPSAITSTTSSILASTSTVVSTSTETSTSAVALPTSSTTACASSLCGVGIDYGAITNDALLGGIFFSGDPADSVTGCANYCKNRAGCTGFLYFHKEGSVAKFCAPLTGRASEISVPQDGSGTKIYDLDCFTECASITTTVSSTTSLIDLSTSTEAPSTTTSIDLPTSSPIVCGVNSLCGVGVDYGATNTDRFLDMISSGGPSSSVTGCANYCKTLAGCTGFLYYNLEGTFDQFCWPFTGRASEIAVPEDGSEVKIYDLDCLTGCPSITTSSTVLLTTFSTELSTSTEVSSSTSVDVPTSSPTACSTAKLPPADSVCGVDAYSSNALEPLRGSYDEPATVETCADYCSTSSSCTGFFVGDGECLAFTSKFAETVVYDGPSRYAAYEIGCFTGCSSMPSLTSTVLSTMSLVASTTSSDVSTSTGVSTSTEISSSTSVDVSTSTDISSTTVSDTISTSSLSTTSSISEDSTTSSQLTSTTAYPTISTSSTRGYNLSTTAPYPTTTLLGPSVTPGASTAIEIIISTNVHTITSCAPGTGCAIGSVITEITSLTTTYCPENQTPTITPSPPKPSIPTGYTISTVYSTHTSTILQCPKSIINCLLDSITIVNVEVYTTICPIADVEGHPTGVGHGHSSHGHGLASSVPVGGGSAGTAVAGHSPSATAVAGSSGSSSGSGSSNSGSGDTPEISTTSPTYPTGATPPSNSSTLIPYFEASSSGAITSARIAGLVLSAFAGILLC